MVPSGQTYLDKSRGWKPPCYFMHIPKTAGTSLRHMLDRRYTPEQICPAYYTRELLALSRQQLAQYRFFRGHFYNLLPRVVPPPLEIFTFLRAPLERSLSHYDQVLRSDFHYFHHKAHEQGVLREFLEDPETRPMIANYQARSLVWDHDPWEFASQFSAAELSDYKLEMRLESDMLEHLSPQALLEKAIERLESFAFVGLAERFDESLVQLFRRFGWGSPPSAVRENQAPARLRWESLSSGEKAMLQELTQVDQQLYEYACRRLARPRAIAA